MSRLPIFLATVLAGLVGLVLGAMMTIKNNPAFRLTPYPTYSARRAQRLVCQDLCESQWLFGCKAACTLRYWPLPEPKYFSRP